MALLIILAWAYSLVPRLLGLLRSGRGAIDVSAGVQFGGLPALAASALSGCIVVICLVLVALRLGKRPAVGAGVLAAYLAPWLLGAVVAGLLAGDSLAPQLLLYPLVGVTIWLAAPSLATMTTLGWLTIGTAAFSLAFAAVSPLAFFTSGVGVDKSLFGNNLLLAGPYNHSNELGLALALGLSAVLALQRPWPRRVGGLLVLLGIAWTASRTSYAAAAVVLALNVMHAQLRPEQWGRAARVVLVSTTSLVVFTPLVVRSAEAFSRRGQIWLSSLEMWASSPAWGHGPDIYRRAGQTANDLGAYAFHGHNLFVHVLLTGGVVSALGTALLVLLLSKRALHNWPRSMLPVAYLSAFIAGSWLEVVTDYRNLGQLGYASWLPIAIILFARDGRGEPSSVRADARRAD